MMPATMADRFDGQVLSDEWAEWISSVRSWRVFGSLTYRDFIYQDKALEMWQRFVRVLNKNVFGKHYTRKVGHSYFSYILGIEYQTRDVLHFHFLADCPLPFSMIHQIWNSWAGCAWLEMVGQGDRTPLYYVSKYVSKGGEIIPYMNTTAQGRVPLSRPVWWVG
jgi:hypothetical protein